MRLPTEEQCLGYFKEYKVPERIKKHCVKVRDLSVFLANELNKNGLNINIDFVSSLAYMHDMFKLVVIDVFKKDEFYDNVFTEEELSMAKTLKEKYPNMYECEVASEVFKEEFPELTISLKKVSSSSNLDPTWEELVVHYCDWRIFQEEVVLLEERLAYLRKRYLRDDDVWEKREAHVKEQEKKIFAKLAYDPDQLKEKFKNDK